MTGLNLFTYRGDVKNPKHNAVQTALGLPGQEWYHDVKDSESMGTIFIRKAAGDGENGRTTEFVQTCIINQIGYVREVAHQPEPTLSGNLYVSFFGDKPTMYSVSGIAFDAFKCPESDIAAFHSKFLPGGSDKHYQHNPVKTLIDFYDKYRLNFVTGEKTKESDTQVTLTTYNTVYGGSITYVGILVSMFLDLRATVNGVRQYTFSFKFLAIK